MTPDEPTPPDDPAARLPEAETSAAAELVRQFVEHWGVMARAWGINATMGELFALLYITGRDWTADELRAHLRVSRGNVSMNLRELMAWGVVHKVHRRGQRREFYRAEADVWTLVRRIVAERKRRELDPTLGLLARIAREIGDEPTLDRLSHRVGSLRRFFGLIDALATRLMALDPEDLDDLGRLLAPDHEPDA